jgi:carbon storage regulator CsrA
MLVLSRRELQRICISVPGSPGIDIWVEVCEIDGHTVRLGIEAPSNVRIDREEVARRRSEAEGNEPDRAA